MLSGHGAVREADQVAAALLARGDHGDLEARDLRAPSVDQLTLAQDMVRWDHRPAFLPMSARRSRAETRVKTTGDLGAV